MANKHGEEKTKALAKYQMSALVTREMATEIVETLWGEASPVAKTKAILLCHTYNLNPLMNHLFILPFKKKDGGTEYVVAIGIEATRLMAHRPDPTTGTQHNLTYLDLTPRRATRDELEKILGDQADSKKLYFITKIQDIDTGAEAFGLGWWEGSVYGADKGNSPANMASIRSERQALKRLYPAEMPTGVEVVDERFAEAAGEGAVEGEFSEVKEEPVAPEPKEHWCEEHNCPYEKKIRGTSTWYAHKLPDGGWCNEIKKKGAAPAAEAASEAAEPEPVEEKAGLFDAEWLKESLKTLKDKGIKAGSESNLLSFMKTNYKVEAKTVLEGAAKLDKGQAAHFARMIQSTLDMA